MNDLSLGFNAGPPTAAAASHHHHPMWHHALPHELGMYVVQPDPNSIISDPNHSVNVGVIPLLPVDDSSDLAANRYRQGAIQFWQGQQQQQNQHAQPPRTLNFESATNELAGGSATPTCQDCGNQAKKDCTHRRCRTCCRSRGLHCSTHVKSTWVSAARRRERHTDGTVAGGASSGSTSGIKKPRLVNASQTATSHTSTSTTPTRSFDTSSSQQDANLKESLPGQVKAPAVFKCVRVTSVDDGEDEFAYQAVVKIGGHVFKGFLYDQGATPGDGFPNLSHLHLGGGSGGSGSLDHPPEVYGGSGGAYPGAGSGYGNPMN